MSDKCPTHVRRNPACPICARVSRAERESELAALNGSPCVVCGSPLTLGIERTVPVLMVHCNTCGSEVPWHVTQKLNLYKARGKTAASMENDKIRHDAVSAAPQLKGQSNE